MCRCHDAERAVVERAVEEADLGELDASADAGARTELEVAALADEEADAAGSMLAFTERSSAAAEAPAAPPPPPPLLRPPPLLLSSLELEPPM